MSREESAPGTTPEGSVTKSLALYYLTTGEWYQNASLEGPLSAQPTVGMPWSPWEGTMDAASIYLTARCSGVPAILILLRRTTCGQVVESVRQGFAACRPAHWVQLKQLSLSKFFCCWHSSWWACCCFKDFATVVIIMRLVTFEACSLSCFIKNLCVVVAYSHNTEHSQRYVNVNPIHFHSVPVYGHSLVAHTLVRRSDSDSVIACEYYRGVHIFLSPSVTIIAEILQTIWSPNPQTWGATTTHLTLWCFVASLFETKFAHEQVFLLFVC